MKPTFTPLRPDGRRFDDQHAYDPLVVTVAGQDVRLALHRELNRLPQNMKQWRVSDPVSGASVCRVVAHHKGMPVSSAGLGVRAARAAALESIDRLLERVGTVEFLAVIGRARIEHA